jgi:hypothetical protein
VRNKRDVETCLAEARQFLKTAEGGLKREAVFTPEILYNVLGMAIEKYSMGLLFCHGTLADNHTFIDLVEAMSRIVSLPDDLKEELLALQGYQEICSLSHYARKSPDRAGILKMIETTRKLESFVKAVCNEAQVTEGRDAEIDDAPLPA